MFIASETETITTITSENQYACHDLSVLNEQEIHSFAQSKQRAKKVMSDSLGLVDFAIRLVNSVLNLPDRQAKIFRRIKITKVL